MSGIPSVTIGLLFITRYEPPVQYFINFYNLAKQKRLLIVFTVPK